MKRFSWFPFVVAAMLAAPALTRAVEIDEAALKALVTDLASDERKGRGIGTPELDAVTDALEGAFHAAGLAPALPGGFVQESPLLDRPTPETTDRSGADTNPSEAPPRSVVVRNVIGLVKGKAASGHVIIGAHYDHLGISADATAQDRIFNGADDNASGVAALVELARRFAAEPEPPGRTIVFIAFSGEESGLAGSKAYVAAPALPLAEAVAMVNLDTIGRLVDRRLTVLGVGTSDLFEPMLTGMNYAFHFDLALSKEPFHTSDHAPFIEKSIPAIQLFTGGNADYHRVTDSTDKVDFTGLAEVAAFAGEILSYLSDESVEVRFASPAAATTAAPVPPGGEGTTRRRASLGTIPDFERQSGGVLVSGLVPGSPAEKIGILTGDIVVELDGVAVDNLQDYQAGLAARSPGDTVRVVVLRGQERKTFEVTLVARR